jgi:predicted ATP-dependent serine protease
MDDLEFVCSDCGATLPDTCYGRSGKCQDCVASENFSSDDDEYYESAY